MNEEQYTRKCRDDNADFLYSISLDRLQSQLQQIDSVDTKTISLLGFSCTLITILAAAIAIIKITPHEVPLSYVSLGIAAAAFIGILISSLISYRTQGWKVGADLREAKQYSKKYSRTSMLCWAATSFHIAFRYNGRLVNRKLSSVKRNIVLLVIQIVFSVLAILLINLY